jgi:hypothetical protein
MTEESSPSNPLALTPSRQGGGWSIERQRAFLDAMDADANGGGNGHGGTTDFMECRAGWGGDTLQKRDLSGSSALLRRAAQGASVATPRLEDRRSS